MSSAPTDLYRHQPLSQDDDDNDDDGNDDALGHNNSNNNTNGSLNNRFSPMEIAHNDDDLNDVAGDESPSQNTQQHSHQSPIVNTSSSPLSPIMSFIWEIEQKRTAAKNQRRPRHRFSYQGLQRDESDNEDEDDDSASFLDGVAVHSSGINYCHWVYALAAVFLMVLLAVTIMVPKHKGQRKNGHHGGSGHNHNHQHDQAYARTCRQTVFQDFVDDDKEHNDPSDPSQGSGGSGSKPPAAVAALQHSWQDFESQMEAGHNWCRSHNDDNDSKDTTSCACPSRIQPSEHVMDDAEDMAKWMYNVNQNVKLLSSSSSRDQRDVILVGDDLVARWYGELYGSTQKGLSSNAKVFQQYFGNSGSAVNGLALGVTLDETPNLLHRLHTYLKVTNTIQQDQGDEDKAETVLAADPRIWWVVIGHNDLLLQNPDPNEGSSVGCSLPGVVAGVIQSVLYLLQERPKAQVVINSLLPSHAYQPSQEMWQTIHRVNSALECFAAGHDSGRVSYMDATDMFVVGSNSNNGDSIVLNPNLFEQDNPAFPNAKGYQVWGQAIVERVQELLGRRHHVLRRS